jgi:hypothetical protein
MAKYELDTRRASLRGILTSYVDLVGPGGITAYVPSQDLLIVTDIYSLVVLCPASRYVKMHKLRAINLFGQKKGELPGAHILKPEEIFEPDDVRLRSLISSKSLYVGGLIALAQAQQGKGADKRQRMRRSFSTRIDGVVEYECSPFQPVLVGSRYYHALLDHEPVSVYSGVLDNFTDPTVTWRNIPLEQKGIYFEADATFYGIVMPHAKVAVGISEN